MTLLRWMIFPFAFLFFQIVALFISGLYFNWLFPVKSGTDWLIIILLIPLSMNAICLQYFAVAAGIMIAPNHKIGRYIILVIFIYGIINQATKIGFSFDSIDIKINAIESCIAFMMLTVGFFNGGRFDYILISSCFPHFFKTSS